MDKSHQTLKLEEVDKGGLPEASEKEVKCIFKELMKNSSQKPAVSTENLLEDEALSSNSNLKGLLKSESSMNISSTKIGINARLLKSETDCLNHFNDAASSKHVDMLSNDWRNTDEYLVYERACGEDFVQDDTDSARLQSDTACENNKMTNELSPTSFEFSNMDDISISSLIIENVELKAANDVSSYSNDLNMSVVHDRIKTSFDECLYKVNDACGIETCAQHEFKATINSNSNSNESETETEATCKVEKVTVTQDQIENTNIVQHDSVNDIKAIVCQVLRTWAERQTGTWKNRDAHATVSQAKSDTRNVTNVREHVQQIENSFAQKAIKENPTNKKELYTNILQKVLAEDENDQVREETLQLLDETENEEQWKQKFHEILHMFQDLANQMKISNTRIPKHEKCFNYMNGPEEDQNMSLHNLGKQQSCLFNEATTSKGVASVGTNIVYDTRNVAEQTEVISQYSFCCQVSLFAYKLENEVQTDEFLSTTINKDDTEDACDTLIEEQQTIHDYSSPIRDLYTEGSSMSLTKVSGSQTDLLPASYETAPCESNFHTIHIEADSSPASSVMQRRPLCTRLWKVLKEFCMAACFCIQVNKDCVFFMAFFAVFLLCTSLLTAFFYRTLHADSRMFHPPMIRPPTIPAPGIPLYRF